MQLTIDQLNAIRPDGAFAFLRPVLQGSFQVVHTSRNRRTMFPAAT